MEFHYKKGFTHAGGFHSDDVFATAFLQILNPEIEITRGFSVPEGYDGIVYDIGGGAFDHHQSGRRIRENEIPYAAFGLLWEAFGAEIVGEDWVGKFDESFVQALDESDNTGCDHVLALAIADFNNSWMEKQAQPGTRFWEAVAFAKGILERRFEKIKGLQEADRIVGEFVSQSENGVLDLPYYIPWKQAVKGTELYYVIYPSNRGGYSIQAVAEDENKEELKLPFPESWRGATKEELVRQTGIPGIRFCHASGFLCTAEEKEDVLKIANMLINEKKKKEAGQTVIRTAVMEDLKQIADMEAACFPPAEAASYSSIKERMETFLHHFWVMEEKGRLVSVIDGMVSEKEILRDEMYASAALHQEDGSWQMLFSVMTRPEHQGQGYASQVMQQVIKDCQSQGKKGIILTCKERLIGFYERFGFQNEGISGSDHGGAVWYQMRLRF